MAVAKKKKKIFDGRYEILSIVGRGSASVVYRARNIKADGQEVALKVLVKQRYAVPRSDLLRKEALAMVSSRHQYVIRLDDFHSVGDLCYLSMEYAPYGDLRRYTGENGGKLSIAQAKLFLSQAAQALGYIHEADILHRDIKPDNILVVSPKGIRLGDFGVAVLRGDDTSIDELQKGVGTFSYMAPEVIEGIAYEKQSDLYALGVSFYELLTGVHPFENAPLIKQLDVRKDGAFPELRKLVPEVPASINNAVMELLRYDRSDRLPDAEALLEILNSRGRAPRPIPKEDKAAEEAKNEAPKNKTKPKAKSQTKAKPQSKTQKKAKAKVNEAVPAAIKEATERVKKEEEAKSKGSSKGGSKTLAALKKLNEEKKGEAKPITDAPSEVLSKAEDRASEEQRVAGFHSTSRKEKPASSAGFGMEVSPQSLKAQKAESNAASEKAAEPDVDATVVVDPSLFKDIASEPEQVSHPEPSPQQKSASSAVSSLMSSALAGGVDSGTSGQTPNPSMMMEEEQYDSATSSGSKPAAMSAERDFDPFAAEQNAGVETFGDNTPRKRRKPGKKRRLLFILFGLFFLYYASQSFLGGKRGKRQKGPKVTDSMEALDIDTEKKAIPPRLAEEQALAFPHIRSGVYSGEIQGIAGTDKAALLLLVDRAANEMILSIGVPGWKASRFDLSEVEPSETEAGEARFASNGYILKLSALVSEQGVRGKYFNLVTGQAGDWAAVARGKVSDEEVES